MPTRVFLSVQPVPHRKPKGADPFVYREPRPLRYRASWWTRGTTTELYKSKVVASQEEAARLARKWLAQENRHEERLLDTTDQPERYGYVLKKSSRQLDDEIAAALTNTKSAP